MVPILVILTVVVFILVDLALRKVLKSIEHRKIQKARERDWHIKWFIRGFWDGSCDKDISSKSPTEDVIALLRKAADDPCPPVKRYAIAALKKLKQEQDK